MLAVTERERSADDAQRCGDGRHRAGGVLCCPLSARRCCSVKRLGRERPWIFARRLRPRALTRGSLTPQLSIRCPPSALVRVHRLRPRRPHVICVCDGLRHIAPETESLHRPADPRASVWLSGARAAITQSSFELCSAPCKARRFAPPTRVSARGLRALTAPARSSPDGNCVMASTCVSSGQPGDASVRKSPADAFIGLEGTTSATA